MRLRHRKRYISPILLLLAHGCGGGGARVVKPGLLPLSETDGFGIATADLNKIRGFRFDGSRIDINPCGPLATLAIVQGGDRILCTDFMSPWRAGSVSRGEVSIRSLRGGTVASYGLRFHSMATFVAADARHIAFYTLDLPKNGERVITLSWVDLAGGGPAEVVYTRRTGQRWSYRPLSWSPLADRFVYVREGRVYKYTLAARESVFLVDGDDASWSPNGGLIAFRNADHEVGVIGADGKAVRRLMPGRTVLHGLAFSPDGRFLLFSESGSFVDYISTFFTCQSFTEFGVVSLETGKSTVVYSACMGEEANGYTWVRDSPGSRG